ncbi:AraC family transcriptional regulator [Paraliobacillus salinarum]|uniref:AraC family transcriptional regulator n=1 Tax=Paraliobacillus salinarum TaxID=1158996 RepID=UPI0015F3F236|nr:AraC family transcriptional regulator [Paraliobacillus salinarum]
MSQSIGTFQTEEALNQEFYVYECGYEDVKPRDPYQYEPIDYYLIHYIEEGEGLFFINDEVHHLGEKEGFIIPPNTKNNYYPLVGNPWSYRWIGFKGTRCQELFQKCGFLKNSNTGTGNYIYRFDDIEKLSTIFKNVYEYSDNQMPYAALGESYHLINVLIEQHEADLRYKVTNAENYIQQAIDITIKRFNDPNFSIEVLTSELQIERSYLFRLFKKYLNISPKNYLIQARIKKSTELLRRSSSSVEEIAYLVGFNNPSHFSRQFSKYKGISPSKYRSQFKTIRTL